MADPAHGRHLAASGTPPDNLVVLLARADVGLLVAVMAGVAPALLAGLSRLGEDAIDAADADDADPAALALVPLFILWFGVGEVPEIALVGVRFAVGISWLMLVVAEQVNASSGIGHMMMDAEDLLRTGIILVGLLIHAAPGLVSDQVVRLVERRLPDWRPARPSPSGPGPTTARRSPSSG